MKTITWITVYFLVVFTLPTFAQRPYEKNKVLEIDNLKVERNPNELPRRKHRGINNDQGKPSNIVNCPRYIRS